MSSDDNATCVSTKNNETSNASGSVDCVVDAELRCRYQAWGWKVLLPAGVIGLML